MLKLLMSELCTMRKGQTINEVDIYNFRGANPNNSIPVISSMTLNNGIMGYIDKEHISLYKKIGRKGDLSWVTNGYAGKVTLRDSDFLPTEKCGVASIKKKYRESVNPKWLEIYLNSITKKYVVAKEGNGKLEIIQMKNIPVVIPVLKEQKLIVEEYKRNQLIVKQLKEKKSAVKLQVQQLKSTNTDSEPYKLGELFNLFQGHQLTDKYLYDNTGEIPVISGSKGKIKGYLKDSLINESYLPCIIYQTKGNKTFESIVIRSMFNANNTAVLTPKRERMEMYNIDYIQMIIHKNMQDVVNSESGVSYIDTKILGTKIYLPELWKQNEIYAEYKQLSDIKKELLSLINKYSL